jgi:hypothetical protein
MVIRVGLLTTFGPMPRLAAWLTEVGDEEDNECMHF